jgi:hypothetical protein
MVSVVVSIRMRKVFAEVRKMFSNARHAEQDVRKGGLVRTSEPNSCSYEAASSYISSDKREVGSFNSTQAHNFQTSPLEEIERRTVQLFAERYGSKPLRTPMQAHVVTALKSA